MCTKVLRQDVKQLALINKLLVTESWFILTSSKNIGLDYTTTTLNQGLNRSVLLAIKKWAESFQVLPVIEIWIILSTIGNWELNGSNHFQQSRTESFQPLSAIDSWVVSSAVGNQVLNFCKHYPEQRHMKFYWQQRFLVKQLFWKILVLLLKILLLVLAIFFEVCVLSTVSNLLGLKKTLTITPSLFHISSRYRIQLPFCSLNSWSCSCLTNNVLMLFK